MTNKPMLSVERELIAGICDDFEAGRHLKACAGASKLRAILEDQHRPPPVKLYCNVSNVHITCNEDGSYTINPMPAAQHQGEPVAWSLEVEGYTTVLYENYQKALSEQEHFRGRGRTAEIHPLHREQPAPVAVVLPERKTKADYSGYIEQFQSEAAGLYNSALDDVARLNGVKP